MKNKDKNEKYILFLNTYIKPIYTDLYKFIFSIFKDKYIAEDILHDTILCAMDRFHLLKDKNKFKNWIFTIAKRKTIDEIRASRQLGYALEFDNEMAVSSDMNVEDIIITKFDQHNKRLLIKQVLSNMNDIYKRIIILRYYHEFTLTEISTILNINYATVRTRHRRGLMMLEEKLKLMDSGEEIK